jgi:hypothetical protein
VQTKTVQLDDTTKHWLESRPELVRRLKEMRRICENGQREHERLAKAESGLVEQLDATGRELVGARLEKREDREHAKVRAQTRMCEHSKKLRVLTVFGEAGAAERVMQKANRRVRLVCSHA